ncbi:uncharacterized protein LAJ45_01140 [Morchella importuna]|uniref:uncharacterized protein n=1 Tax=Morchella importuna TaxID=1174673 RepID=UPI001E8CB11D|nr:uncharacterized protein LAJ45_01140 [Morchella importuna]KAH8154612.1 hypothetical protein LAJ45_01140 [Morchella importuna]
MTHVLSSRDREIQDLCGQIMHDHMRLDDECDALNAEMRTLQRYIKKRDSLLPPGFLDPTLYEVRSRIMTLNRAIGQHEYRLYHLERIEMRLVKMFAKEARAEQGMPLIKEEEEEEDPIPDEYKCCCSTVVNKKEEGITSAGASGSGSGNKENVIPSDSKTSGGSKKSGLSGKRAAPGTS